MPAYDYECQKCSTTIQITHSMKDTDIERKCEVCGTVLQRLIVPTSFILKGECWTKDGFKKNNYLTKK